MANYTIELRFLENPPLSNLFSFDYKYYMEGLVSEEVYKQKKKEFEQKFLEEVLTENAIKDNELEVYYNGDRALTEFKIKCYQQVGKKCNYIGMYTPDFLIIKRKDGKIHKALIVETKGEIYANDPTFKQKRNFMESAFIKQNNDKFGYNRFDYLYLEDTLEEKDRIVLTLETIKKFFTEE